MEAHLGLTVYLPMIRRRFGGQIQLAPLFPRYLFVWADLQTVRLSSINSTPGVLRLLAFDGQPQPVPIVVIEAVRQMVDNLNAQGGLLDHHFQLGSSVRITDGPLQGLEAIFVGPMKPSERVRVLVQLLGRLNEVEIGVDLLERSSSGHQLHRERRTRGGGRRIRRA